MKTENQSKNSHEVIVFKVQSNNQILFMLNLQIHREVSERTMASSQGHNVPKTEIQICDQTVTKFFL